MVPAPDLRSAGKQAFTQWNVPSRSPTYTRSPFTHGDAFMYESLTFHFSLPVARSRA